jgi:hypothetical protein
VTETGKVRIKSNVSAATLAQSVKTASIVGTVKDDDGIDIPLSAVVLVDPTQNPALIGTCGMYIMVYNPSTGLFENQRTPAVFKSGAGSGAGNTALWTPTTGKKFRIRGGVAFCGNDATSAAGSTVSLLDNAATIMNVIHIGTTTTGLSVPFSFGGNGYLSTAANNVLNINLSAAFTASSVYVTVWGTEE